MIINFLSSTDIRNISRKKFEKDYFKYERQLAGVYEINSDGKRILRKVHSGQLSHIKLTVPVVHPFFWQPNSLYWESSPSILSTLLDTSDEDLANTILYKDYIDEDQDIDESAQEEVYYPKSFYTSVGIGAIRTHLNKINVTKLIKDIKSRMIPSISVPEWLILLRQLKILESFKNIPLDPRVAILDVIPVPPPDIRPKWLNKLYEKILDINYRLERLIKLKAPTVNVFRDMHLLQQFVNSLFCHSHHSLLNALSDQKDILSKESNNGNKRFLKFSGTEYWDTEFLNSLMAEFEDLIYEDHGEILIDMGDEFYKAYRGDLVYGNWKYSQSGRSIKIYKYLVMSEQDLIQDISTLLISLCIDPFHIMNESSDKAIEHLDKILTYGRSGILTANYNEDYVESMKKVLATSSDIDNVDNDGRSALIIETINNNEKSVSELISRGANLNKSDQEKMTPLMFASISGNVRMIELLSINGANINATNEVGQTAIILAIHFENVDAVEALMTAGANIHARDALGNTALMKAITLGNESIIKLLLDGGVDVDVQNNDGNTALDFVPDGQRKILKQLVKTKSSRDKEYVPWLIPKSPHKDITNTLSTVSIKYVLSATQHYLRCPYFLALQNHYKFNTPTSYFDNSRHLHEIKNTKRKLKEQVIGVIAGASKKATIINTEVKNMFTNVLLLKNKKVNIDFFSTDKISLRIIVFQPDLIATNQSDKVCEISLKQIEMYQKPELHHFLKSYIYKLSLENILLKMNNQIPTRVIASVVHLRHAPLCLEEKYSVFEDHFIETAIDEQLIISLDKQLARIATLMPSKEFIACSDCPRQVTDICDYFINVSCQQKGES